MFRSIILFISALSVVGSLANSELSQFEVKKNEAASTKVVYFAVDNSCKLNDTWLDDVKEEAKKLVSSLAQDVHFAVASFGGPDTEVGSYLKELIPLTQISNGFNDINAAIDSIQEMSEFCVQDVGAALRDAVKRLEPYKTESGSVLYIVTSTYVDENSTTWEHEVAKNLIENRIQLVAVELGDFEFSFCEKSLEQFSELTNALYYYNETFDSDIFFTINERIASIVEEPIETGRKILLYLVGNMIPGQTINGTISIPDAYNQRFAVALQTIANNSFYCLKLSKPPYNREFCFGDITDNYKNNEKTMEKIDFFTIIGMNWNSLSSKIFSVVSTYSEPMWEYEIFSRDHTQFVFLVTSDFNASATLPTELPL